MASVAFLLDLILMVMPSTVSHSMETIRILMYQLSFLIDEIATVLERCSAQEAKVIADVVKATKRSIDKHL